MYFIDVQNSNLELLKKKKGSLSLNRTTESARCHFHITNYVLCHKIFLVILATRPSFFFLLLFFFLSASSALPNFVFFSGLYLCQWGSCLKRFSFETTLRFMVNKFVEFEDISHSNEPKQKNANSAAKQQISWRSPLTFV